MIIDAHAHIMRRVQGQSSAGPTRSLAYGKVMRGNDEVFRMLPPMCRETSFPPEVLLENMDWAGVEKTVLLQGPFYGEANEYLWQAVKQWPDRFIPAAYVDPRAPDARDTFRKVTEEYGFPILKFEMSEAAGLTGLYPDLRLDEQAFAWIWEAAERQHLVVTLDLGAIGNRAYQTAALKDILERHPKMRVVLAHLAYPPIGYEQPEQLEPVWEEQLLLARNPNVWLDLSALPAHSTRDDYPYPTARRYIQRAVDLVGADKIMWGSDAPGVLQHATYPQLLVYVTRYCDFLAPAELKKILGETAWAVYGK